MGSVPLIYSFGAGAESRYALGIVIFFGVLIMTFLTLIMIPVIYQTFARHTQSPLAVTRALESQESLKTLQKNKKNS